MAVSAVAVVSGDGASKDEKRLITCCTKKYDYLWKTQTFQKKKKQTCESRTRFWIYLFSFIFFG